MVVNRAGAKITYPVPGVVRRVLAHSPGLMLTEHILDAGAVLPEHNHPHEQMVYIVSGRIELILNGNLFIMEAGDSLDLPPGASHKVTALVKTVALDIFSPARQDYL